MKEAERPWRHAFGEEQTGAGSVRTAVYFDKDDFDRIRGVAIRRGLSVSRVIREATLRGIDA